MNFYYSDHVNSHVTKRKDELGRESRTSAHDCSQESIIAICTCITRAPLNTSHDAVWVTVLFCQHNIKIIIFKLRTVFFKLSKVSQYEHVKLVPKIEYPGREPRVLVTFCSFIFFNCSVRGGKKTVQLFVLNTLFFNNYQCKLELDICLAHGPFVVHKLINKSIAILSFTFYFTFCFQKNFSIVPFILVFLLPIQLTHRINSEQKEAGR